jgi:hypothetical protein
VTQSVEVANTGEFALTIRAGNGRPSTTVRSPGQPSATCMHGTTKLHACPISPLHHVLAPWQAMPEGGMQHSQMWTRDLAFSK